MDRSLLRETECYLVNLGTAAAANGRGSALFRGGIRRTLGYYPGIARVIPECSPADFVVLHRNLIECDPFLPDSALVKMPKTW